MIERTNSKLVHINAELYSTLNATPVASRGWFASLPRWLAAIVLLVTSPISMFAQSMQLQTVHTFAVPPRNPHGGLLQTPDGFLYGTTMEGGPEGHGTIFKMTTNGVLAEVLPLDSPSGSGPFASLTKGPDGNLYGTAGGGGAYGRGSVFKVTINGPMTVTNLHSFNGADGQLPRAPLLLGMDGNLYSTTAGNGVTNNGSVFKITTTGLFTNLFVFYGTNNGAYPDGGLVQGADGSLYGVTARGGIYNRGIVFKIDSNGVFTNLHTFDGPHGGQPSASLVFGKDGLLYGTTYDGGDYGFGAAFKITTDGDLTLLGSLDRTNGASAVASLCQDANGDFYGTCFGDNVINFGSIFKVTSNGNLSAVVSFGYTNGALSFAELLRSSDGNFYGTTGKGGANNSGTVFKLSDNGTLTTLYSFEYDGANPNGTLLRAPDGNLYGSTTAGGTDALGEIFRIDPNGGFTNLASFEWINGGYPYGNLISGPDGDFYGTVTYSSADLSIGSVFKCSAGGAISRLAPFFKTNGTAPYAGLLLGPDGDFYGTTRDGGATGADLGTVFKFSTNGTITTLVSFNGTNGSHPVATLIQGNDGWFYGTTSYGGANNKGTVFKVATNGVLTTVASFNGLNGSYPY